MRDHAAALGVARPAVTSWPIGVLLLGVPQDRVKALRSDFDQAMKDPALLADAEQANIGIEPMSGSAIAAFVKNAYRTPTAVAAKAAHMLG